MKRLMAHLRFRRERDRVLDDLLRQMAALDRRARIERELRLAAKAERHKWMKRPCLPVRFCAGFDGRRYWGC